jgi:cytochrome b subunit of formate dehydrogenase
MRKNPLPNRVFLFLVSLLAMLILAPASYGQFSSQDCLDCHGDADMMEGMENLIVTEDALAESVHEFNDCTDCHQVDDVPHSEVTGPTCDACHDIAQEEFAASIHGRSHAEGVLEAPDCGSCHGGHSIRYLDDPESRVAPRNQPETCGECHSDSEIIRKFYMSVANPSEAYQRSAHFSALMQDDREGQEPPTCSTCHAGHGVLRASDPNSSIFNGGVEKLCGGCHEAVHDIYTTSVHGRAHRAGNDNAPTCNSCHGEHSVTRPDQGQSDAEIVRLSSETCVDCHADQKMIQTMGLSALRVSSYQESYHGLAEAAGSTDVPRCASCHGTHNIDRSDNPKSLVHKDNLLFTCGRCHEGVTEQFAAIRVHSLYTEETTTPAGFVRIIYLLLIASVIGGMLVHNFILYSRYLREKYRAERRLKNVRRFSRFQIAQHAILVIGFFLLAASGFGLKFGDSFWVGWLQDIGFDEELRRWTHRISAIVMIVQSLIQAVWFVVSSEGRRDIMALIPTYKDVVDLVQNIRYHLFKTEHPPRYDRYDYAEKAEYLALIWGTVIMAVTGLALWVPEIVTNYLPAWTIEVATVVHYYEAILATAAIVVWHWFFVIYHPREFPMRLTWMTGTMTEHDYRHHHPLEYEKLKEDSDRIIPPEYDQHDRPTSDT